MNLRTLADLLHEARRLCGHDDFVVIGSLSILGLEGDLQVPAEMALSIDVDCYTRDDPGRIFDLVPQLGEDSAYHQQAGVYLDAVSPMLPALPQGWRERLIARRIGDVVAHFLDPNDAAISKYARGEPRDIRWTRAGIDCGAVSLPVLRSRLRTTTFLDDDEARRARDRIDADEAWFRERRARGPAARTRGR